MSLLQTEFSTEKIRSVLIYLFVSTFFVSNLLQSYILGVLILFVLATTNFKNLHFKNTFFNKLNILIWLFLLIQILSNAIASQGFTDIKGLESKLSLLLFPFLLPLIKDSISKLYLLIAATIGILVMYIINLYYLNFTNVLETNESFKIGVSFLHTSYVAIITCFMLHLYIVEYIINKKSIYWFYHVMPIVFIVTIIISTSKIGYLTLVFLIFFNLIVYVRKFKAYLTMLIVFLAVTVLGFIAIKTTTISDRFKESYEEIFHPNPDPNYVMSTGERLVAWEISLEVIKDNFWLGVGVGKEKEVLVKYYQKNGYTTNADLKLDAHQQFLQTFVGTGILGFVILVFIFLLPLYESITQKDVLLFGFLFIFLLFGLTESMLERQSGIMSFFFFLLFLFLKNNSKEKVLHLSK